MYTIKQARQLAGYTQKEMAKELGISESTYYKYENYLTYMRMDTAFLFSKLTNLNIEDIFFTEELRKFSTKKELTR